ncbi:DDE-type integrase/transposase/recombinase [Vibrio renipiscarius]|uniref:Mu transposase C-terminal domain-containing protein n=1 Tax=Vibrio renipiscarius TaxID=1461322 RepID=UPI003552BCAD
MPSTTFANFYRKANTDNCESNENISDAEVSLLGEGTTFTELSAFDDETLKEVKFRLRLLKQVNVQCEQINVKTIEPLRVSLQQENQRPIPSAITIYRWWLIFRKSGFDPVSLVPKTRKRGNRTIKVPQVVSDFMDQAVNQVISAEKININSAFRRVRRKIRQYNLSHATHFKYPNYESIRKRVHKKTPFEKLLALKGPRVAKREFRKMGKKILTANILERVEVDHTVLDLFVVHDEYRVAIGRPYLTQLVDCYSKAVIGFYLGFEPPSYASVALALKNAIQHKEKLLADFPSVENEWPCYGIPDLLVTDNGKEFISKDFANACESLLINIHQNKVETPDNKPHVERQFGTSNSLLLNDLPGKAFSNYLEREGYDSIGEATLTLNEIKEIYLKWLVDIYHKKSNTRGTNCPNVTWRQGSKLWRPDEFVGTVEELDFRFAKYGQKMLRKEGVTVATGLSYSSERLSEYRGIKGDHKVKFKYNIENMGLIWVLDEDNEEYFAVPAIDFEYASTISFWQHKQNMAIKRKLYNSEYDEDAEVDAEIAIEELVDKSMNKKKTAIRNKRRGARYQENAERAKSLKRDMTENCIHTEKNEPDVDDNDAWGIDYV